MKKKTNYIRMYSIPMALTATCGIQVWQPEKIGKWQTCRDLQNIIFELSWHSMRFQEISTSGRFAWKQKTEGPNFRKAPLENLRGGSARHVAEAWMLEALSWKCHRIQGESLTNLMSPCVSLRVWNFEGWIVADSERYWYCYIVCNFKLLSGKKVA